MPNWESQPTIMMAGTIDAEDVGEAKLKHNPQWQSIFSSRIRVFSPYSSKPKVLLCAIVLLAANSIAATVARADAITFTLSSTAVTVGSGTDVVFTGTITNNSGVDLNATDLFFNFFGYDPTALTPSQDLGVATEFLIPNGNTSVSVDLFNVLLGAVPPGSSFPIQVQLEDINLDLSGTQLVTVSVPGGVPPVPEPTTLLSLGTGIVGMFAQRWRRKISHN